MVTIKDIATATGVSPTTVSNVINGKAGRVSSDMQKKINAAIKELGYVPNMSAKSLVSKSSKVIGFVNHVLTIRGSNFMEDPFLSRFIGILEYVLRENGYFLMLRTVETPEEFDAFLRAWNLDGSFFPAFFKMIFLKRLQSVPRIYRLFLLTVTFIRIIFVTLVSMILGEVRCPHNISSTKDTAILHLPHSTLKEKAY